jgi:hypothetical protein
MMIGGSADGCPLLGLNQTSLLHRGTDAIDPKATSRAKNTNPCRYAVTDLSFELNH